MINYHPTLVEELNKVGLPVYYEHFLSGRAYPCISYFEVLNMDRLVGDTIGYSDITFQIKVWSKDVSDLAKYSAEVDKTLRPLGFRRNFTGEVFEGDLGAKILRYTAIAAEKY